MPPEVYGEMLDAARYSVRAAIKALYDVRAVDDDGTRKFWARNIRWTVP